MALQLQYTSAHLNIATKVDEIYLEPTPSLTVLRHDSFTDAIFRELAKGARSTCRGQSSAFENDPVCERGTYLNSISQSLVAA